MIHRPLLYTRTQRRCTCSRKGLHLFPSKKLSCFVELLLLSLRQLTANHNHWTRLRTQPAACKNTNKLYRTLHLHLCSWQMMSQSDLQDDVKKIPAIFICLFWVCLFVCAAGSGRVPYWGWRGGLGWLLQDEVPLGPFLGPPAFLESVHNLPAAGQTYSWQHTVICIVLFIENKNIFKDISGKLYIH